MDCESCGRHRPSEQVVPARSTNGAVLMVCGRCRRHLAGRIEASADASCHVGDGALITVWGCDGSVRSSGAVMAVPSAPAVTAA